MQVEASAKEQKNHIQRNLIIRLFSLSALYIVLVILAIALPLLLWRMKLLDTAPFVSFTRWQGLPFELFGGLISSVLAVITWIEIRKRKSRKLAKLLPIALCLLVTLSASFNIAESTFNWRFNSDYIAFEKGAKAILIGVNPYIETENPYVYPPLVGQILTFVYQLVANFPLLPNQTSDQSWGIVFYFFQCAQLLLVPLAYFLTYKFSKKIGLNALPASLIVAALFLFNDAVVRTLNFHQTNLWILNCFLIGILFQQTYPFLSGFAVALGVHIKMYPFILIAPWVVLRKWKLLIGATVGLVGIAIIQTNFGRDWTILQDFIAYLKVVSKPTPYRNSSINSIVYNFFKIPNKVFSTSFDLVPIIVGLITVLLIIWFLIRFIRREKIYRATTFGATYERQAFWNELFRMFGHSMDAVALGLLISPSVFEHHYIVAIPLAVWAIATSRWDKPWAVGFSIFLIFCMPTFDLFPLSFHPLVGLLLLIYFTDPQSTQSYFLRLEKRKPLFIESHNPLPIRT